LSANKHIPLPNFGHRPIIHSAVMNTRYYYYYYCDSHKNWSLTHSVAHGRNAQRVASEETVHDGGVILNGLHSWRLPPFFTAGSLFEESLLSDTRLGLRMDPSSWGSLVSLNAELPASSKSSGVEPHMFAMPLRRLSMTEPVTCRAGPGQLQLEPQCTLATVLPYTVERPPGCVFAVLAFTWEHPAP
jgi:hypothetical protein